MNKPTVMGGGNKTVGIPQVLDVFPQSTTQVAVVPKSPTTSIVLSMDQGNAATAALQTLDFTTIPSSQIAQIGFSAEKGLSTTLDGFLARLDQKTAGRVFELFDRLEKGVKDADLATVVEQVKNPPKPGFFARLRGKPAAEAAREAYEKIRDLISGKTKTLSDEMVRLERELGVEMQKLLVELQAMENLKRSYSGHLDEFAVSAAVAQMFLSQAREYVASEEARLSGTQDSREQIYLRELQTKLQLLESRAGALEGAYTRLPADQMVIHQIEEAGVTTLQETMTTAASRFASIKMTLIAIHGTFAVKGVLDMNAKSAAMEKQLSDARQVLMKETVTIAANAPGDNRIAQAAEIEKIIAQTQEVAGIIADARQKNAEKFETARQKFVAARQVLAQLK